MTAGCAVRGCCGAAPQPPLAATRGARAPQAAATAGVTRGDLLGRAAAPARPAGQPRSRGGAGVSLHRARNGRGPRWAAASLPDRRLLNPGRRGRPRPGGAGGGGAEAGEEPGPAVEPQPGAAGAAAAGAAGPGETQRRPAGAPRTGARGAPRGRSRAPAEGGGGGRSAPRRPVSRRGLPW